MKDVKLNEAGAKLWDLSKAPVHRKYMMPEVNGRLSEFETVARRTGNGYALEKIDEVRHWFDELGKFGRGHWTIGQAQRNAQQAIFKLEQSI